MVHPQVLQRQEGLAHEAGRGLEIDVGLVGSTSPLVIAIARGWRD